MNIWILTGPAGAGKNTVAAKFAQTRKNCAVIDVDVVRWFVLQPHKAPWDGKEGKDQQMLGVKNSCVLAENFLKQGYDVVILDVLSEETAGMYRQLLPGNQIILLLPTFEEIQKRNLSRPPKLKDAEIKMIYESQVSFKEYDQKIDNSRLLPEDVVRMILDAK